MYTVNYTYYRTYAHQRQFKTYAAARRFFNGLRNRAGITSKELRLPVDFLV
jgi:hypothetical protein